MDTWQPAQRDVAERKHRLRLAALQRLVRQSGFRKKGDYFDLGSYFGCYKIKGERFLHWGYVLAKPNIFGFPKLPKDAIKLNGEYFIPGDYYGKFQDQWNNTHGREVNAKANAITAASNYEMLKPSKWRKFFDADPVLPEPAPFRDVLPPPADAKVIKAERNRLDYLRRKPRRQSSQ